MGNASVEQLGVADNQSVQAGSSKDTQNGVVSSSNIDIIEDDLSLITRGHATTIDALHGAAKQQSTMQCSTGIRDQKDFEQLICIEIFSGSGRLTAAIRKLGMRAVAIDRSSQRTSGPVTILDLTKEQDLEYLLQFIKSEKDNIILVHLAPPCGTASAARNRRHKKLEAEGFSLPAPLRSHEHPMGLPSLKGLDAEKVALANKLYSATFTIAMLCISLSLTVSIENPVNSLFWETDPIKELLKTFPGHFNVFDSCMMGGERDKGTAWWCSDGSFDSFNLRCDRNHERKAWTPVVVAQGKLKFPTAEEASYPLLLCDRVAHLMKEKAFKLGYEQLSSMQEQAKQQQSSALQHVNMGFLPRGQKIKPLVSEFGRYQVWILPPSHNDEDVKKILKNLPKGARIVHRKLVNWGEGRVCNVDGMMSINSEHKTDNDKVEKVSIGIPRDPSDFVRAAIEAGHPRFLEFKCINNIDELVRSNVIEHPHLVMSRRVKWLKRWTDRAAALQSSEQQLHDTLDPDCKAVLKGKRLLLFGEMLEDIGYPDKSLISDICSGFRVTGWVRDSGCFVRLPKQPSMTVKHLLGMTRGLNEAVLSRSSATEDSDLVRASWDETLAELDKQWIWKDDSGNFKGISLTHRFGLRQKRKVRVIDNFKTSGINATCGMPEKQKLFGLDFIATTLVRALTLTDGSIGMSLQGKTFDLSSAYKQFPIHGEDRSFIRLAVPVPGEARCEIFGVNSLPFGATGSVAGFLRVSTAIFHILTMGLGVWAGTFFDDFPIISRSDLSGQTEKQVAHVLDLLGMRFSRDGKKWVPFDESMSVLGVVLDFSSLSEGKVIFKHTDARRDELDETLSKHLDSNSLTQKEAESLRGRLIWFESFLFGRIANLSLHEIGKRATCLGTSHLLTPPLKRALEFFRSRVLQGPPIEISRAIGETSFVFTDGAFEPSTEHPGTIGGVLYSSDGSTISYFSEVVPALVMSAYMEASDNPIYIIELLAALIAIRSWGSVCKNQFIVSFIDNEASRAALIKAWSDVSLANNILRLYVDEEMSCGWRPWFGRVPSHSNPADDPSRLDTGALEKQGVPRVRVDWQDDFIQSLISR